mgnify:CR=1 FL=1
MCARAVTTPALNFSYDTNLQSPRFVMEGSTEIALPPSLKEALFSHQHQSEF